MYMYSLFFVLVQTFVQPVVLILTAGSDKLSTGAKVCMLIAIFV